MKALERAWTRAPRRRALPALESQPALLDPWSAGARFSNVDPRSRRFRGRLGGALGIGLWTINTTKGNRDEFGAEQGRKTRNRGAVGPDRGGARRMKERWFPDAYVFAAIAVVIVCVAALIMGRTPMQVGTDFGESFWSLIPFTMQTSFVVIGVGILAVAPPVKRLVMARRASPSPERGGRRCRVRRHRRVAAQLGVQPDLRRHFEPGGQQAGQGGGLSGGRHRRLSWPGQRLGVGFSSSAGMLLDWAPRSYLAPRQGGSDDKRRAAAVSALRRNFRRPGRSWAHRGLAKFFVSISTQQTLPFVIGVYSAPPGAKKSFKVIELPSLVNPLGGGSIAGAAQALNINPNRILTSLTRVKTREQAGEAHSRARARPVVKRGQT